VTKEVAFTLVPGGLSLCLNKKMSVVSSSHIRFKEIQKQVFAGADESVILGLLDTAQDIFKFSEGSITIEDDKFLYNGVELHNTLTVRMIALLKDGANISIFVKFLDNLMQNPSFRAVNELYGFLEESKLPMTSDGCFLAYKKVRYYYMDIYSNTMDNSVGNKVSMVRNSVDEDSARTCSAGLHCAAFDYLRHYGKSDCDDRIVIVKVNPKDVVAVPQDYDNQKMRVCEYLVVDEVANDGKTQISNYFVGNKTDEEARAIIAGLKTLLTSEFDLEKSPSINEEVYCASMTQLKKQNFLDKVIASYAMQTTKETYLSASFSVKSLAGWISDWSA
jgi:hypothetical protein